MTYLELCKHVHRLIRPGEGDPGTVPSAVTGQTGILGEIVYWVQRAWLDIQNEEAEWLWAQLQCSLSVTLVGGRTYAMSSVTVAEAGVTVEKCTPMKLRDGRPFGLIYLTSDGVGYQQPVWYVPYEDWRGYFDYGTRPSGRPQHFTILPDRRLQFDPTPDATYTFTCDFKAVPQTLAANSDDPAAYPASGRGLPAAYHDVIAWRAVKMYALTRQEASSLYEMADREERRLLEKMRREFLPAQFLDEALGDFA